MVKLLAFLMQGVFLCLLDKNFLLKENTICSILQ